MIKQIEDRINNVLSSFPIVKKVVKRSYQLSMYLVSPKIKSEGNIERISPNDEMEYFFGYYDKSPWDVNDRYMLCLRTNNTYKDVAPYDQIAEILLFDTQNNNSYEVIGKTNSWNVQQGCMLQWLGPDYSEKIIYNDFRDGEYCSVILNIKTKEEKKIPMPIYSVSNDGKFALSLDFSRLHRLRKGYGYSNKEEVNKDGCPNETCIWKIELETGKISSILKYTDFLNFETREEMVNADHKVNHIMLNPSGNRFMVLHRWLQGNKKYTRLITVNVDGTDMYNLSDDNMVSHCNWKNDNEIIGYLNKKDKGNGYYLMKDKTNQYECMFPELKKDGHPSYSPNNEIILTDTYPDRSRVSSIYVINNNNISTVARVFSPFKYDNDFRCDLHPRWNRSGNMIAFDSVFEHKRGLYTIKLKEADYV